ncbi:tomoregulin-2-like protein [Willisornis vidua]|uniref:Tomoregulin-2-like protein n=1 Tax=Willisornis vidua TaxID=1566151 RepID=A0ABQ9D7A1_9PASS|nr:tomoregulin-2-like protein [Willisornis vidua]
MPVLPGEPCHLQLSAVRAHALARTGYDDRENDLFLCDTNTCKFDGECLRIGDSVTCVCQFKCNNDYVPVCGSNGDTYQNECYLKQAACKQQSEILLVSEGSCATDAGSGSGDGGLQQAQTMKTRIIKIDNHNNALKSTGRGSDD